MTERVLVCVAWPYANGSIHVGHAAGVYLPADIFARYSRMLGHEVAMVSGSDAHGTPVTIAADQQGVGPEAIISKFQDEFLETWERLGISFDLFTSTHTDNHTQVTQDMFLRMLERGYLYKDTMRQPYCLSDERFLPDRYVEGRCPHCRQRRRARRPVRPLRHDPRSRRADRTQVPHLRQRTRNPRHRALLHQAQRVRGQAARLDEPAGALQAQRQELHHRVCRRRTQGPRHYPRPRLGRARTGRWLRQTSASTYGSRR